MEENKTQEVKQKLTYEELENVATQLSNQIKQYDGKLREVYSVFKRLDYLFKVLENSNVFNKEFVDKCSEEVVYLMIPNESKEDTKEEDKTEE